MSIDTTGGHPDMDYAEHLRTYNGFVRGATVLTALVLFILASMAFFLL
ncbi:MAG TPA: aa3-type cytochrome c oxidase subunit IV [Hyphomicrobiaceae bacterium]|nr:aa3-type cytochrome c oxidase subunit IV [Hyphomicrobiaceae bacterium]